MDAAREDEIKIVPEGKSEAWCSSAPEGWKHEGVLVKLELRRSGQVRVGICEKCGQIFASLVPHQRRK